MESAGLKKIVTAAISVARKADIASRREGWSAEIVGPVAAALLHKALENEGPTGVANALLKAYEEK